MISIKVQYLLFINSLIFGCYLGITFDILNLIKSKHYWIRVLRDISFWVIQAIIASMFFYNISYGVIPKYLFILFGVGFVLYRMFLRNQFLLNLDILINKTKIIYKKSSKQRKFLFPYDNYHLMRNLYMKKIRKVKK